MPLAEKYNIVVSMFILNLFIMEEGEHLIFLTLTQILDMEVEQLEGMIII